MWQREVDPTPRAHAEAVSYCSALVVDGANGFRLPASAELRTLLYEPVGIADPPDACTPSIDQAAFPETPSAEHWTSTERAGEPVYVDFADGRTHTAAASTAFFVRCVRTPDGTDTALLVQEP
jgi:Protein of unknown function (DUF1566)